MPSDQSPELKAALAEYARVEAELDASIKRIRDALKEADMRLPCGCIGKCDPYAHDTAPDWDGTPDGPDCTRCPECDQKIYEGKEHICE